MEMIRIKLRTTLDKKLFNNYLKCHFIIRKIRIQPGAVTEVTFNEFTDIKKKSIVDILRECITEQNKILSECLKTKDREKSSKELARS